ncbi:hypothetical protein PAPPERLAPAPP_01020 [Brevundimonas phage vB_BpoS-Papperlapapp]|uniref:Uncharacterized protein n=1 Tax=Brevundimonas phage vB_BpoS-Domovoi TaxID=2948598 RepID=A0A9E7MR63_9CAUD|nr:hypothetical protein DOMOVOI_05800 [Brevundimonas phage vB_BpoS-Domovoi]USN15844.1 hypothetical protein PAPPERLAPAPP_01020 [Brevundimonas phage vB_BpoS-Papperlapapp]
MVNAAARFVNLNAAFDSVKVNAALTNMVNGPADPSPRYTIGRKS